MNDTISIKQNLNFFDLCKTTFLLSIYGSSFRTLYLVFFIPPFIIALTGFQADFNYRGFHYRDVLSLLTNTLFPLLIYMLLLLFATTYVWFANRKRFQNVEYTFNHWGMTKTGIDYEFTRPWRGFVKYKETKSFFLLFISGNDAHFIQKKMLADENQLNDFRKLIKENVGPSSETIY